jgi:site-specific DNA-methyltransferase (adenine-specific)
MKPYYQQDGITIYHGDCREVLPHIAHFDVIVSDPPYGCSATTGWGGVYDGFELVGDDNLEMRDWLIGKSVLGLPLIVFGSPRIRAPFCTAKLIWAKGEHTGMGDLSFPWKPDYEEIYIFGKSFNGPRTSSVLTFYARTDSGRHHPTEKPLGLMKELLRKCPAGIVLDPFVGSGSTLCAAKDLGRQAIGIEIEERYCEIAAKRLAQGVLDFDDKTLDGNARV